MNLRTRGEGVKKSEIFADYVINGSPQTQKTSPRHPSHITYVVTLGQALYSPHLGDWSYLETERENDTFT